ncbi:MAG: prepilin peptidase [Terriglobia bacterium]
MIAFPTGISYAFAALFGLIWGSFLNVCIARLPLHQSVVAPRSRCPDCRSLIRWYDNIPVLSYLLLRGRCRKCQKRISPFYPLVEILTACLFVVALAEFGPTRDFLKVIIFGMLMIVLIFTDLRERVIPHSVTLCGGVLGLILSLAVPVNDAVFGWVFRQMGFTLPVRLSSLVGAVTGGLFGAGLLYGVAWCFRRFGNPDKEYLGFGDVTLMFVVGTFLGIPLTYLAILLGSLAGTLVAVPFRLVSGRFQNYQWPYGSFLGAAAIYALMGGPALIAAYLRWSGFR